ncbi:RDD family protein [Granulicoccus phenolivorans]|uniref:RDD family protein n=1 Tax=Granulicoccus phenolivorans TaxID=266854 RepID=UPI0004179AE7|nr:RDD family protein [Granulicoccus phenolivorans]
MSEQIPVGTPPVPPGRHAAPPGWYADPLDARRERYWDSLTWSREVRERTPGAEPAGESGYGGIGARLVARVLDDLLVLLLYLALGGVLFSLLPGFAEANVAYSNQVLEAVRAGATSLPDPPESFRTASMVMMGLWFVLFLLYDTLFVARFGWTPGKKLLRLRVTGSAAAPGAVGFGGAFLRALVAAIARFGALYFLFPLIDFLWALGNRKRQTLHDLAGRTVVIRRG